ncbi:protein ANTAGONIST OF LIKE HETEROCHROMATIN PROTEIN 1-like [Anneissia japonica]|uniref:protein ANTAGONIST OF LIKE HETEROCHROMATIN PROTEIN 1-like n=1 Tax=Anneissia japonica TaxID=1529436 RepID=UPI00142598A3|nr:protein ANTAGONIST OF LIKE HETEROCHROMATIN PROTEIN 1-like [Anneissia japonica]
MSRDTFTILCNILRPNLQRRVTNFGNGMTVEQVVGMTLWRLATCCELRSIGNLFGVHMSTVCRSIQQVCQAIIDNMFNDYIVWPTVDRLRATVAGFNEIHGFPQCAGAIDGSLIPIKVPHFSSSDYYNCKGSYSVIIQAVVDHKLKFTDTNVGWPGKVHDAMVFRNSSLFERGESGRLFPRSTVQMGGTDVPIFIIGDPAYTLLPWLMKRFSQRGNVDRRHLVFNYKLSKARMVVEQAFGNLKGRWRILMRRNDSHISKILMIVNTCCVLHNFCIEQNDDYDVILNQFPEDIEDEVAQDIPLPDALGIRNALVNNLQ